MQDLGRGGLLRSDRKSLLHVSFEFSQSSAAKKIAEVN